MARAENTTRDNMHDKAPNSCGGGRGAARLISPRLYSNSGRAIYRLYYRRGFVHLLACSGVVIKTTDTNMIGVGVGGRSAEDRSFSAELRLAVDFRRPAEPPRARSACPRKSAEAGAAPHAPLGHSSTSTPRASPPARPHLLHRLRALPTRPRPPATAESAARGGGAAAPACCGRSDRLLPTTLSPAS